MIKSKTNKIHYWLAVGFIAHLLIAPNATILKVLTGDFDPFMLIVLRGLIILLVTLPFVFIHMKKFTKYNFIYSVAGGISMAIAMISYIFAFKYSPATYVIVLSLASPIVLVLLSRLFMRDKLNLRTAAGVSLAAIGAFVAVSLPLALHGNAGFDFYPLATALIAINCIFFPLALIFYRKANENGLPLSATQGAAMVAVLLISFAGLFSIGEPVPLETIALQSWVAIAYSAVIVTFLARMMMVASYERIGSGQAASLIYLESIVAIIIPVIALGENLSLSVTLGGVLILLGLYFTEKHKSRWHFHIHRHH